MGLNLEEARSKIERAKKHIKDFDAVRVAFLGSNPYKVFTKFNPEFNVTQSILGPLPTLPVEMALIAGDAAHTLRIALDYLACDLVRAAGFSTKNIYFPICESAEKYKVDSPGKTKGMPVNAKEIIDRIEPYGGGNDVLWALHVLDITDKHRLLITVSSQIARTYQLKLSPEPTSFCIQFASPKGLEEGDVLGEVARNCEANERINFGFEIAFGEPEVIAGKPVVETFTYMADLVEEIVNYFACNF